VALIIEYADLIAPANDAGSLSEADRAALIYLRNWADDPEFLQADVTFCLVAEQLSRLHQDLVRNPYAVAVEIELPDRAERLEFIDAQAKDRDWAALSHLPREAVAELTAGLSRVHVQQILADAIRRGAKLDAPALMARKKELIEAECFGLLEFFEPRFNLDLVAGADAAVRELRNAAKLLRSGRLDALPMGYLICGPVGTGKSFLAACFTGELGAPCVQLLNIRSQWQGVTEANLQKLLTIFRAMGPLGVIIDEADAWLGDRDAAGDSGTSSRIFAALSAFMADTSLRGRVIWFLITSRPDLLPVDIKRQGRAEEHVPLFPPATAADRQALFVALTRKNGIQTPLTSIEKQFQDAGAPRLSGADLEAVCIRAKRLSALRESSSVEAADFAQAFAQFVPPAYAEEVEYQAVAAALECTNRDLLPPPYHNMPRENLVRRLRELRPFVK
jgi:SpoVK/Ycf46/Vps4 family AAA+-type ATPase